MAALGAIAIRPAAAAAYQDVVAVGSFNSKAALEAEWHYNYPWGTRHNGAAEMAPAQVSVGDGGKLFLRATPVAGQGAIRYHSGAIHAKDHIVVDAQFPQWLIQGNFSAPAMRGAWPAFWLNANEGWPPEIDILEFKGDAVNWCNTFRTDKDVQTTKVPVSQPAAYHHYAAQLRLAPNGTDVIVTYLIDGRTVANHSGPNYAGRRLRLIINLQMEGSSGAPGPAQAITFTAHNVSVGRMPA